MADQTKATSRSIYLDTQAAELAMKRLQTEGDKLKLKINAGEAAGKAMNKELAKLDEVNGKIKSVQAQLDNGLKPSLIQQQNLVRQLSNELNRLSDSDPRFAAKLENYKKQNAELAIMRERLNGAAHAEKGLKDGSTGFVKVFTHVAEVFTSFSIIQKVSSAVADFFSGTIKEADQAEAALSRFKNILENIGRVDVFERLTEKANEMAKRFKYLDNDDVLEVFTKLITYGKLTENQINEVTPVIINFAAKQKISLEESADVITKALEGSGRALKTYGINVKDGGSVTERFGIIMNELKTRVDGAADAFGETLPGRIAIAKQRLRDLQEDIGNKVTPALIKMYEFAAKAIDAIGLLGKAIAYSVTTGSIKSGITILRAEGIQQQINEENARAANAIASGAQRQKTIEDKQKYLNNINDQIRKMEGQIALAQTTGDYELENRLSKKIEVYKTVSDKLTNEFTSGNKVLGTGNADIDKEAQKKLEDIRKEIDKLMGEIRVDIARATITPLDAAYVEIEQKLKERIDKINKAFMAGAITAKEAASDIAQIQLDAISNINKEFEKLHKRIKSADFVFQPIIGDQKKFEEDLIKSIGKTLDNISKKPSIADKVIAIFNRDKKATNDLAILQAPTGKDRLRAQLKELEDEKQRAVENSDKTQAQIAKIEGEYRQKKRELIVEYYKSAIDEIYGYTQKAINIMDTLNQAQNARENSQLNREIKNNNKRRKELEAISKTKVITEIEARKQINAIDQEEQKKKDELEKKQLERGKRIALVQALINGAMGITAVLAAKPGVSDILTLGVWRAINIAFTVATTAAQIAAITAQKFEKGGIANGASHAEGGIKLYDSKSRRVVGEMEGGEPYMILSKNFRRNNPDFIAAALDSSMNRNGARIQPFWMSRPYSRLDYGKIIESQQIVKRYESGGIIGSGSETVQVANNDQSLKAVSELLDKNHAIMEQLARSTTFLNNILIKGIKSSVSLTQLDAAYDQRARIIGDASV